MMLFVVRLLLFLIYSLNIINGFKDTLSIAVVTDIHIGQTCNHDDLPFTYENCLPVRTLTDAVGKMNSLSLDGAFASGDIANWGLYEEFTKAREIFDTYLEVPWWPLMGNHDSWPYKWTNGTFDQTDSPLGDQYFAEIYGDILAANYSKMNSTQAARYKSAIISGWPLQTCVNQDNKSVNSWFHNFEISFPEFSDSFKILNLDWVSRSTAWPEPGVGPQAELHDYECGTTDWLSNSLKAADPNSKFFLFQHHPFHNVEILDPFGQNTIYNFTFDNYQLKRVQEILGL
jgi:3',5'-cyclic AMP phosphodiesterase CpdA